MKWLYAVLFIAIMAWIVYPKFAEPQRKADQRHTAALEENAKRFKDWAYVAREKEISPGETIKLVIVPHPWGGEFMDTKCLIYTNQEFKQASMICPDADRNYIADKE